MAVGDITRVGNATNFGFTTYISPTTGRTHSFAGVFPRGLVSHQNVLYLYFQPSLGGVGAPGGGALAPLSTSDGTARLLTPGLWSVATPDFYGSAVSHRGRLYVSNGRALFRVSEPLDAQGGPGVSRIGSASNPLANVGGMISDDRNRLIAFRFRGDSQADRGRFAYVLEYGEVNITTGVIANPRRLSGLPFSQQANERSIGGAAVHGGTVYLYVGSVNGRLYSVDLAAATLTPVGAALSGTEGRPEGIAAHGGKLYMVGDNTDALYTVEVPAPPAADLTADGLGVNVVLSSPRLDLVTPPARADFEADALEVSVALSSAAIRTEPVTGRVRRVRYGFHVPAAAGLPEWSFWNGDGPVTIDGRVYETGQFASHDDAAEPVSSFVSGELEAVFGTRLVFSPHGVFEAWLLSGDAAGRKAYAYTITEDDPGVWRIENTTGIGRLSRPEQDVNNGTVSVLLSTNPSDRATLPQILNHGTMQDLFPGETSMRFRGALDRSYKLPWPSI